MSAATDWEIALEHIMWCQGHGMTPAAVLVAIGAPVPINPSWQDALAAVFREQRQLSQSKAA